MDADFARLIKILVTLEQELELAFDSDSKPDSPENERLRYIYALSAIGLFLGKITRSKKAQKRIHELAVALQDLNRGVTDHLLQRSETGGVNPGDDTRTWCTRAKVALATRGLVLAGLTRKDAAKEVATTFPEINKLAAFEREEPSSTTSKILNWYDEFRKPADKSRIKNAHARTIFEDGQQTLDQAAQSSERLHNFAKRFLRQALADLS